MLDALAAMGSPPIEQTSPVEARAAYAQLAMMPVPEEVDRVDDRHVPVPEGDDIPVRVYTPPDAVAGEAGVPVWFHGGGWVIGDIATADPTCRPIAKRSAAVVVTVDYRLAPDDPAHAATHRCPPAPTCNDPNPTPPH